MQTFEKSGNKPQDTTVILRDGIDMEQYDILISPQIPKKYAYALNSKTKNEPVAVVCGVEYPRVALTRSELQKFAEEINRAIAHELMCETGFCEVSYGGLTAQVDFYAEYRSGIGGSHEDGSVEHVAELTDDLVKIRVLYDEFGREYPDYAAILEQKLN